MIELFVGFLLFCACVGVVVRFWRIALGVLGAFAVLVLILATISYNAPDSRQARAEEAARSVAAAQVTPEQRAAARANAERWAELDRRFPAPAR